MPGSGTETLGASTISIAVPPEIARRAKLKAVKLGIPDNTVCVTDNPVNENDVSVKLPSAIGIRAPNAEPLFLLKIEPFESPVMPSISKTVFPVFAKRGDTGIISTWKASIPVPMALELLLSCTALLFANVIIIDNTSPS